MTMRGGKFILRGSLKAICVALTTGACALPALAQAADSAVAQGTDPAFAWAAAPIVAEATNRTVAQTATRTVAVAPVAASTDLATYRTLFAKLDGKAWADAKAGILALDAQDPMRAYLLATFYLAKDSPRVELFDILDLLAKAPHLPQSDQLARLAEKRGAQILPDRPQVRQLIYMGGAPQRGILKPIKGDPLAELLAPQITAAIKADTPAVAEALLDSQGVGLTPACLTEHRQRVAWSYFITGDVANARRLATRAASEGFGPYVAPAQWVAGLSAWRQHDWTGAATAFAAVARQADDTDLRAAGYYWAARANMAARQPQKVGALLQAAAREEESFYGLLAAETLGLPPPRGMNRDHLTTADQQRIAALPDVRIATTLARLNRVTDADEVLRYQAALSGAENFDALARQASDLSLPRTQLWLSQRSATGVKARAYTRYPRPDWTPSGGWRVDKALVFAHTLQESRFQTDVVSSAGARGLMQVLPGTASDMALARGETLNAADLYNPSVNMEYGQRYLEKLSTSSATDGLLAKVIAAYNAGPLPVERWKSQIRDEGDPLLFIESVPYYETRAYVNVVLRNYWMYQMENGNRSAALNALAQGLWSRFPGKAGSLAVRLTSAGRAAGAD